MIVPSSAVSQFINDLWPLAFHEESIYRQGKRRDVWFTNDGERYPMDFSYCGNKADWYQFDSHQDAWYFGQWVNPVTKQILSYVEGDITLITCETSPIYRKELQSMTDFEGRNGLDDHDGRHWEKLQQEDTPILKASTLDLYKDIPLTPNQFKTRHPARDFDHKSDINEVAPGEDAPRAGESETPPVNCEKGGNL